MIYPDTGLTNIYLRPGEICIAGPTALISTVLGSCVSVTMFNASSGTGIICHGLLPVCRKSDAKNCTVRQCGELYKYVDCSLYTMIKKMDSFGFRRSGLEVKLFGGSEIISSQGRPSGWKTVGHENIMTSARIIQLEGFALAAYDVGGTAGRKIHFDAGTGEIYLRRLSKSRNGIYCDDEYGSYISSAARPDIVKDVL